MVIVFYYTKILKTGKLIFSLLMHLIYALIIIFM